MSNNNPYVKGRNWGEIQLEENKIVFKGEDKPWFQIPYTHISNVQQASNKNELAFELNVEDESANENNYNLCEMRFYVPEPQKKEGEEKNNEENEDDDNEEKEKSENVKTKAEILKQNILKIAKIGTVSDSIAHVSDIQMITPRGKFDLYFMKNFLKIQGQSHNYKILNKNITRVFLIPKMDGHNHFLILQLNYPILQGNTSYHFLIFQIRDEFETQIELNIPEEMKNVYKFKLQSKIDVDSENKEEKAKSENNENDEKNKEGKEEENKNKDNNILDGNIKDILAQLFNNIVNIGIIIPSKNFTFSKGPYLKCSYKANDGVLYPLEKCLLFAHKPVIFISHDDIRSVDMSRLHESTISQRTFDLTVVTKKEEFNFKGFEKFEFEYLLKYFDGKKIKVNNLDEGHNYVDIGPTSTRRRAPVDEAPLELPSDEEIIGDDYYSSESSYEDAEDEGDDDEDDEEDEESEKKQKKHSHKDKEKHHHHHHHKKKKSKENESDK